MLKSKKWALLSGMMLVSLVLAACQPQQVQVPVTVVVEQTKVQEVIQTVEVMLPTAVPAASFSTPHPILGDVRNRQGIAHCTNKDELITSVYPFLTPEERQAIQMDTNIPKDHWAYTQPQAQYPFDPEAGMALFEEAGWTLPEGATFRTNEAGEEFNLKFTTTNAQFRQTWAAVFEQNMAACGLRIVRFHVPASWWFGDTTGVARRDYELGAFAWVGQADPGGVTLYACDQIPLPENGWEGQNGMGWCNETASAAIKKANNTLDRQERIDNYAIFQEEFAKDMPSLPLFNRVETTATTAGFVGFEPAPGEAYQTYNTHEWEIPGQDTIVLALSQEPASLFTLVEDAYVASVAASFIYGRPYTSLNYDYAVIYHKQLPTLENGGAVMNTVEVKEGDKVVDANGDVVEVAAGTKLLDVDGNEVEFSGTAVNMPQLVVTGEFVDGLTWSDGTPVTKADMELADRINCDPESGATSFFICERIASIEYPDDQTAVYSLVPGWLYPEYFLVGLPSAYPAHREVGDGRKLGDVPASEWATLAEIAECPMGYGPYTLECGDWAKGQSMTFNANPNFVFGPPKTESVVIQFITDTNQAVAQLLTGEVDVVLSETTPGQEQTLTDAEAAGTVDAHIEPSATWEHIDMQLFTK
jgi:ABC-type transport system substrate-binding protein